MKDTRTIDMNQTSSAIDHVFRLWQSEYAAMENDRILADLQSRFRIGPNEHELVRRIVDNLRTSPSAGAAATPTMDNASLYAPAQPMNKPGRD